MSGATTATELNELRKQHVDPGSARRNGFAKLVASSSKR
jgi:hypothetical protein